MRAIELDFVRRPRDWTVWAMLAVALFIAIDAGRGYFELKSALEVGSRRVAEEQRRAPAEGVVSDQTQRELDNARRVLLDLALPWEALFRSVEVAAGEHAALLSIEPEVGRGQVRITGEARDYLAVLNFMVSLDADRTLERVHLISHELREEDPDHPYHFALVGHWRTAP